MAEWRKGPTSETSMIFTILCSDSGRKVRLLTGMSMSLCPKASLFRFFVPKYNQNKTKRNRHTERPWWVLMGLTHWRLLDLEWETAYIMDRILGPLLGSIRKPPIHWIILFHLLILSNFISLKHITFFPQRYCGGKWDNLLNTKTFLIHPWEVSRGAMKEKVKI